MTNIEPATLRQPARADAILLIVTGARRWILRLGLAAVVAAAVLTYAIVRAGFPDGAKGVLAVIGIAAVISPPVILAAFWLALGELVRLPDRLRRVPLEAREHGEQLRELFDRARSARGSKLQLTRILWHVTRLGASARETLTPYAPLLPLLSVPFLAATAIAAVAVAVEVLAACIVAVVLATG
jgi:hypothetical protein